MVTIESLHLYPLKSARGIALDAADVLPTGLAIPGGRDREWLVVNKRGKFLTQRTHPRLATITATPLQVGASAALQMLAPGQPALVVHPPLPDSAGEVGVEIWQQHAVATDAGDAAAAWLGAVLGEAVRLVHAGSGMVRNANPQYTGGRPVPVLFSDGYPILVCNRASLDDINRQMPAPIPMDRFRPNIVLAGLEAWTEDRIATLEIGPLRLRLVKPCTRCVIPSLDQATGLPAADPTPVLRRQRFDRKLKGVTFGENAIVESAIGGVLRVGAPVTITLDT